MGNADKKHIIAILQGIFNRCCSGEDKQAIAFAINFIIDAARTPTREAIMAALDEQWESGGLSEAKRIINKLFDAQCAS